jgi:hypothetical protein
MLKLSILKKRARTLLLSLEVIIKTLFICITRYSLNLKLLAEILLDFIVGIIQASGFHLLLSHEVLILPQ